MDKRFHNRIHSIILGVLLLLGSSGVSFSQGKQPDPEPQATGLIPFSEEQAATFRKQHRRIKKVHLNKVGLERVNAARKKHNLHKLGKESTLPIGGEVEAIMGEQEPSPSGAADSTAQTGAEQTMGVLPGYVDNSQTQWFPPIRNQGSLASCVSFSVTYTQLSYMYAFQHGLTINNTDNTSKFSPKWTYNMVNGGANDGTYFSTNFNLLAKHGAPTWAEVPYDGTDYKSWSLNPSVWRNAISVRTNPVQYVYNVSTDAGLDQVKQLLTNGYILILGTYINSWQFTTIKDDPSTTEDNAFVGKAAAYWLNGTAGAHSMTLVGFNDHIWTDINNNGVVDAGEKGALRIANSWGTSWREAGFTWLAYDALKTASAVAGGPSAGRIKALQSDMVYQMTVKQSYQPSLLAEFTVNHLKRNQLRMRVGTSDLTGSTPTTTWTPGAISLMGGAYAFDGSTTAVSGTFVFDLTELKPADSTSKKYYIGIEDSAAGDTASLSAYKIIDPTAGSDIPTQNPLPISSDAGTAYSHITYGLSSTNVSPVSVSTATPVSGSAPLEVSFSGTSSYDPDGSISSYLWNFGDGASATGAVVSHIYSTPGSHTAQLTVTDNQGAQHTSSIIITVDPDPNDISSPNNLSAQLAGNIVSLNWADNSLNEESFRIERAVKLKRSISSYSTVGHVNSNITNYSETVPSGTYYYRVQAYSLSTGKSSGYSNTVQVRIRN